jgi:hypothetical protein
MASEKLFGKNIKPACKYCELSTAQTEQGIICPRGGVVPPDHSCRKFTYDPTKRIPPRPIPLETYKTEDFAI